jgi:hypothetical protein
MLSFLSKSLAVLASLQAVSGMAMPRVEKPFEVSKRASGPVNAVYFTNWFVALYSGRATSHMRFNTDLHI